MKNIIRNSRVNARSDWSFKDPDKPKEDKKLTFTKYGPKIKKSNKKDKSIKKTDDFYKSQEWLRIRYRVLKKYGGECMACGRSRKRHGVIVHVDHILPRSKFPRHELRFENLQILCEDCNLGKGNIDQTDWRPERQFQDDAEMQLVISGSNYI